VQCLPNQGSQFENRSAVPSKSGVAIREQNAKIPEELVEPRQGTATDWAEAEQGIPLIHRNRISGRT